MHLQKKLNFSPDTGLESSTNLNIGIPPNVAGGAPVPGDPLNDTSVGSAKDKRTANKLSNRLLLKGDESLVFSYNSFRVYKKLTSQIFCFA
ncbi:MAG: hypothetical protein U0T81_14625 [Saprospiraceae bacterium]